MKPKLEILIADDHSLILEGYKAIIKDQEEFDANVWCVTNCQEAYNIITSGQHHFDIAIFDWILPTFNEFLNGGDLALLTKRCLPSTRNIIITSHEEAFELYNITKNIKPSGLLVKSDFNAGEMLLAIQRINEGEVWYSETVRQSIRQVNARQDFLDNYNRQIILLLSKGIKTKNLPQHLPLGISAIDKRKAQIKDYFLIQGGNDEDIIREAKRLGLI